MHLAVGCVDALLTKTCVQACMLGFMQHAFESCEVGLEAAWPVNSPQPIHSPANCGASHYIVTYIQLCVEQGGMSLGLHPSCGIPCLKAYASSQP